MKDINGFMKTVLKHISEKDDRVCQNCGCIGSRSKWFGKIPLRRLPMCDVLFALCPLCGEKTIKVPPHEIARVAFKHVEKEEKDSGRDCLSSEIARLTAERDMLRAEADRLERDYNTASKCAEAVIAERDAAVAAKERAEEALRRADDANNETQKAIWAAREQIARAERNITCSRAIAAEQDAKPDHTADSSKMVPADPYSGKLGDTNLRLLAAKMHAALGLLKRQGVYHPAMESLREEGFLHGLNLPGEES